MLTREQYENKINSFTSKINKINSDISKGSFHCCGNHSFNSICGNFGGSKNIDQRRPNDDPIWRNNVKRIHNEWNSCMTIELAKTKNDLWEVQKQVAQDEQEAQIKAMREAIADQVRLEQEKIMQSEENQQVIINEDLGKKIRTGGKVISFGYNSAGIEPIKEKSIALGSLSLIALIMGAFIVLR